MAKWLCADGSLYNTDCFRKIEIYYMGGEEEWWGVRGIYTVPDERDGTKRAAELKPDELHTDGIEVYWVDLGVVGSMEIANFYVDKLSKWLQASEIDDLE